MPLRPIVDVYHAISDPRRRELIELISRSETTVQPLVDEFEVSFAAISQHLRILREAGLVHVRPEGRSRIYSATLSGLREVHHWTGQFRDYRRARMLRVSK